MNEKNGGTGGAGLTPFDAARHQRYFKISKPQSGNTGIQDKTGYGT